MIKAKFLVSGDQQEHVTAVQIHTYDSKNEENLIADYEVEIEEYHEDGSLTGFILFDDEDSAKEVFCYLVSTGDVYLVNIKGEITSTEIIAPYESSKAV